jgi:hypothetical protein
MATIKDVSDGVNPYFSELVWDDGSGSVENMVFMRIRDATNLGLNVFWTLSENLFFASGESRDFLAETKDYDFTIGQLTPVENTDYEANTAEDGSGTDISSELTVSYPSGDEFNGKGTIVRVAFGSTAGYLTKLSLRTLNAMVYDDPVLVLAEDDTSKAAYGQRIRTIEARWTREVDVAQATVDNRLARKKDPKTILNVVVPNGSTPNMMLILQRTFSDRVTVSYSDMGISEDFFIEGHRLTVSEGGTYITRELLLQGV